MNRWHPLLQLFLARLREFYREPVAVFWVYGFPLILAIALGFAFSGGQPTASAIETSGQTSVAVQRSDDGRESEELQKYLQSQGVAAEVLPPEQCREKLARGKVALVIVPSPDRYSYHYDPTRPGSRLARFRVDDLVQRWKARPAPWPTEDRESSEPGGRYIDYLIPGLIGFNLLGGGLWGVGFVIVDMRVRKLLTRFLATPMRRSDFLLSVLGGRLLFVFPEMAVLLLAGTLIFGVPIRGSLLALALVGLLGGATFAGIGLVLACRTRKTETVSGMINLITLPMWLFSGTFFPPEHFERFGPAVRPLIQALPLTQVNDALRAVMGGASLQEVRVPLLILAGWVVASFFLALKWFRWK